MDLGVPKPRRHKGDIMSPEKRSALMSRIRGRDTLPERMVSEALTLRRLTWEGHARDLPGRPDFLFRESRVAIFVDGDFWHGWRFPQWRDKLSEAWELKIATNRARDQRNHRRLRKDGWIVLRLWEHQIHGNLERAIRRVLVALGIDS
jgi:DNA mismatch endonuclease (patch repair protein)